VHRKGCLTQVSRCQRNSNSKKDGNEEKRAGYITKLIVNKYFQLLLLSQQNQSILQPQTRKPTQMHLIFQYIEGEDFSWYKFVTQIDFVATEITENAFCIFHFTSTLFHLIFLITRQMGKRFVNLMRLKNVANYICCACWMPRN